MKPQNMYFKEEEIDPEMLEVCRTIWESDWATTTETCWGHIDFDGTQDYGNRQVEPGCDPYICIGVNSIEAVAKLQSILSPYSMVLQYGWRINADPETCNWRGVPFEVAVRPINECRTVYTAKSVVAAYESIARTILAES